MGLFSRKKNHPEPSPQPTPRMEPERWIRQESYKPVGRTVQIIEESLDIMEKTFNPDTFVGRFRMISNQTCELLYVPGVMIKGIPVKEMYRYLRDEDQIYRQFIDKLFANGKEDRLVYQMEEIGGYLSQMNRDYIVHRMHEAGKKFHFCTIDFRERGKEYIYVTKDPSIKPGDTITVPVGNGFVPEQKLAQVIRVMDMGLEDLQIPLEKLRCVDRKLKKITCPNCGAALEVSVGNKTGTCNKCGAQFYLIGVE